MIRYYIFGIGFAVFAFGAYYWAWNVYEANLYCQTHSGSYCDNGDRP